MSYKNDKNKMNQEMENHKKAVMLVIKITFVVLAVAVVAFAVSLVMTLFKGDFFKSSKDTVAPTVQPREGSTVIGYLGEAPTYRKYVTVSDDKDASPELKINSESVDINKVGSYKVYYKAIDSAGNESKVLTITYVVKNGEYSDSKLMAMIEPLARELGMSNNMSKVELIGEIYSFVNSKIRWSGGIGESNIPDIDRDNWKTDWQEEAIRTLELYNDGECEGDCYSYYAVSKAFFEYFDIKNVGLRRDMSIDEDYGTHFWQIVDIGGGKWYYYDGTRLAGEFSDGSKNACLITHEKLTSYKTSKNEDYFYKISKVPACVDYSSAGISTYPKIATEEIN